MVDKLVLELAVSLGITREDNPDLFEELAAAVESDKEVNSLETFLFTAEKETANTVRFEREKPTCPVRYVYVDKWWMAQHGDPDTLTVAIGAGKVTFEVPKSAAKSRAKSRA